MAVIIDSQANQRRIFQFGWYGGVDFLNPEKFEAENLKGLRRTPPLLIVELSD